jgi:hypothetical protein
MIFPRAGPQLRRVGSIDPVNHVKHDRLPTVSKNELHSPIDFPMRLKPNRDGSPLDYSPTQYHRPPSPALPTSKRGMSVAEGGAVIVDGCVFFQGSLFGDNDSFLCLMR